MDASAAANGAFDKQASLKRLGGSVDLLKDMFQFFVEDAPPLLNALETSLAKSDIDEAYRAAHSLKGLASNFDAHVVTRPAKQIEELLRKKDIAGAVSLVADVRKGVDACIAAGQSLLQPDTVVPPHSTR